MLYSDNNLFAGNKFYSDLMDNLTGLKKSIPPHDIYFLRSRLDIACISISNIKNLLSQRKSLSFIDIVKTQGSLSEIRECLVFINRLRLADTTNIIKQIENLIFSVTSHGVGRVN